MGDITKWFVALYKFPFRVENTERAVTEIKEDLARIKEGVVWKDTCEICKSGLVRLIDHLKHQGVSTPPIEKILADVSSMDEKE